MGMYSTLKLKVNLQSDANLISILDFMMSRRPHKNPRRELVEQEGIELNDVLFTTERWTRMLRSGLADFNEYSEPTLTYEKIPDTEWDYYVHFTCHFTIKNYNDEIGCFLDFLSKYLYKDGDVTGFFYYEEWEAPTSIKVVDGKLKLMGDTFEDYDFLYN